MKNKVTAIQEVQKAVEKACSEVILYLKTSTRPASERAHEIIDDVLEKHGCESPEGKIVAGGLLSAEPHEKGKGVLKKGMPIVIDIYPRSKETGYFADMTRTVCIGRPPQKLQILYNTVLEAQELAIGMIKPGVKCSQINKAVVSFFHDKGYPRSGKGKEFKFAEGFVHSVGHGVGLKIHERPALRKYSRDILKEGDVITIEPGLYYKDVGGVRIEDMLLVTKTGYKNLTKFPKEFVI